MRAWTVRPEQIAGIVRVAEAQAVVQSERFDSGDGLNAPASKVVAHFHGIADWISICVPPQLVARRASKFIKPAIHKAFQ
jgi:N12 class adenine-specific DNA methylase